MHYRGWLQEGAREVPIFFASILSGQRAMDRVSRPRLIHGLRLSLLSPPAIFAPANAEEQCREHWVICGNAT